ncbi:MAG: hypothetical protein ACOC5R_03870 [Elusimicrobiota bacterium]
MKKYLIFAILVLLFCGSARAVTVDGDDSDWIEISKSTKTNSSVIDSTSSIREWIWTDKTDDVQVYGSTSAQASNDIKEVRFKSDGNNLYGLIRFKSLDVSATGYVFPYIQIAVDYDDDSGATIFKDDNVDSYDQPTVNDNARWERLIHVYQSTSSNDEVYYKADSIRIFVSGDETPHYTQGDYSHKLSTSGNPSGYIEFSVPFGEGSSGIGHESYYRGTSVNFTVACFYHEAAWDGGSEGEVKDTDKEANISDCITPESNTEKEVQDNCVDYYFTLRFDADGYIEENNLPEISNFKIDGKTSNKEVIVKDRVPKFTWDFSDSDSGDIQRALRVDISTSYSMANSTTAVVVLEEDAFEALYPEDSYLTLAENTTYYFKAHIIDSVGGISKGVRQSFYTVSSALDIRNDIVELKVDWNNPFYSGEATKIRYSVPEGVDEQVFLGIYSVSGRLVKALVNNEVKLSDVVHTEYWRGKDEQGMEVGSGIYLVHLRVGGEYKTKKVCFIK